MLRDLTSGMLVASILTAAVAAQRTGQPAPDITWMSTFHFDGIKNEKLSQLQGSAVLLEFWIHDIDECEARIPKLNALHKRLFDRGLVVVGVTIGDAKGVEDYLQKHEVAYPVAIAAWPGYAKTMTIPYTVLIGPDGNVVWSGTASEFDAAQIEPVLKGARPANLAAGLEDVGKLAVAGKLGEAYGKAKELLSAGALSPEAKEQAERRVAAAEATVATAIESAVAFAEDSDFYRAFAELDPIAKSYQGVPRADEASQQLAALLADKKKKREIDAGIVFAPIEAMQKRRQYDDAYKAFKKLVTQWSNTRAAQLANAAALAIEKGGKLGYDRGCGACIAADKTCSLHAKKKR